MDVTIIGCGYVGLVTATCLASIGHTVRGVEKDAKKLKTLLDGHCPIFEPGLHELMREHYASGQLQFTDSVKAAATIPSRPSVTLRIAGQSRSAGCSQKKPVSSVTVCRTPITPAITVKGAAHGYAARKPSRCSVLDPRKRAI